MDWMDRAEHYAAHPDKLPPRRAGRLWVSAGDAARTPSGPPTGGGTPASPTASPAPSRTGPSWSSTRKSRCSRWPVGRRLRSEEHTSELQSRQYLVCRLLLEKKKKTDSVALRYMCRT